MMGPALQQPGAPSSHDPLMRGRAGQRADPAAIKLSNLNCNHNNVASSLPAAHTAGSETNPGPQQFPPNIPLQPSVLQCWVCVPSCAAAGLCSINGRVRGAGRHSLSPQSTLARHSLPAATIRCVPLAALITRTGQNSGARGSENYFNIGDKATKHAVQFGRQPRP